MDKVGLAINGIYVEATSNQSLIDIARRQGIPIPGLCYHPEVKSSGGSCRLCLVEVIQNGSMRLVTACNYPVTEGIEVSTDTPLVQRIRSTVIELLLSRVPDAEIIRGIAEEYGIGDTRFRKDGEEYRDRCIACGLCVQVCEEIVGVSAISMLNRGPDKVPGTPYRESSSTCIGCGACAYVCPTGAISMIDDEAVRKIWNSEFTLRRCSICGRPYMPEAQIAWMVMTAGAESSLFDRCPDCR